MSNQALIEAVWGLFARAKSGDLKATLQASVVAVIVIVPAVFGAYLWSQSVYSLGVQSGKDLAAAKIDDLMRSNQRLIDDSGRMAHANAEVVRDAIAKAREDDAVIIAELTTKIAELRSELDAPPAGKSSEDHIRRAAELDRANAEIESQAAKLAELGRANADLNRLLGEAQSREELGEAVHSQELEALREEQKSRIAALEAEWQKRVDDARARPDDGAHPAPAADESTAVPDDPSCLPTGEKRTFRFGETVIHCDSQVLVAFGGSNITSTRVTIDGKEDWLRTGASLSLGDSKCKIWHSGFKRPDSGGGKLIEAFVRC